MCRLSVSLESSPESLYRRRSVKFTAIGYQTYGFRHCGTTSECIWVRRRHFLRRLRSHLQNFHFHYHIRTVSKNCSCSTQNILLLLS